MLDKQFREVVNGFCKRNNMTPEQLGHKSEYFNRNKIDDVFNNEIGMIGFTVANRFVKAMKKIEPGFQCNLKSKVGTKKGK